MILNCLKKQYVSKSCRTNWAVMVRKALPKCPTSPWLLQNLKAEKNPNSWWILFKLFLYPKQFKGLHCWAGKDLAPNCWALKSGSSCQICAFKMDQLQTVGQLSGTVLLTASEVDPAREKKGRIPEKHSLGTYLPFATKPLSETGF